MSSRLKQREPTEPAGAASARGAAGLFADAAVEQSGRPGAGAGVRSRGLSGAPSPAPAASGSPAPRRRPPAMDLRRPPPRTSSDPDGNGAERVRRGGTDDPNQEEPMTRTLLMHTPGLLRAAWPCLAMLLVSWGLAPDRRKPEASIGSPSVLRAISGHRMRRSKVGPTAYSASTSCAGGNWLQVQSAAAASAGRHSTVGLYTRRPALASSSSRPATTSSAHRFRTGTDPTSSFVATVNHRQENLSVVGLGSVAGTYDSTIQDLGPFAARRRRDVLQQERAEHVAISPTIRAVSAFRS